MRKARIALFAVFASLGIAALAYAQTAQQNIYKVEANATTGGKTSKPKPAQVDFDVTVTEANGNRPAAVAKWEVAFEGIRQNSAKWKYKCTTTKINQASSVDGCPKKSIIGSGFVVNVAGQSGNPAHKSDALQCNLKLTLVNSGENKATLFLYGTPSPPASDPNGPKYKCPLQIDDGIPAKFSKSSGGAKLSFTVPAKPFLHPIDGIDNVVVQVTATVKKQTTKYKRKTIGYFETVGCKDRKRDVRAGFTTEAGQKGSATDTVPC